MFSGITRNVLVLGIVSFLTDASTEIIYPLLPIFLTEVIGASTLFVGLVEGIAESTASLFKVFSGWFSDKIGRRKILAVIGYGISGCTRPIIAASTQAWHVLAARFTDRLGKGFRGAPRDALLSESVDKSKWGKAFGFHRSMDHAGAVVGPIIAFLLFMVFPGNYRLVFWLATIPAFLSVFALAIFVQEKRKGARGQEDTLEKSKVSFSLRSFDMRFKLYLIILFIFTLGNSSDAFLILRAKSLGVSDKMIPILWAVHNIVKVVFSTPGGSLSDRIGRRKIIIAGWGIYGLVYLGFAAATNNLHIWILFLTYGLYHAFTEGTEKALVADLVPSEHRGTAYGLFSFAIGVGALPASLILGLLWKTYSPEIAFTFGAGMAILAMVLFYFFISIKSVGFRK
ncbi:MFS transporter [Candidatus Poribacteria bacterium]|nr:MFS transporter [Candidatus Poribacteria bacterium]